MNNKLTSLERGNTRTTKRKLFSDIWSWKELRKPILYSLIWFCIVFACGILFYQQVEGGIKEMLGTPKFQTDSGVVGLFYNNFFVSIIMLIAPLFVVAVNGFLMGWALKYVILTAGLEKGIIIYLVGILPHGIFELSGFFLAAGIGMKLKTVFWNFYKKRINKQEVLLSLEKTLSTMGIVSILLIVAAFIEHFITPKLLSYIV